MAPKKPAKPNGFFMFASEFKNRHGRKYASMKEACDAAAPYWAKMNAQEKQKYQDMAREEKGSGKKYTSEGLDVEELTRKEKEQEQFQEKMRQDIRQIIELASMKGSEALASETFFLIHFNIFCFHPPSDQYYPAEVAAVCFNLKDGVKPENVFHEFVKPGPMPLGYSFDAKQHSEETHKISVPYDDGENNMEEVFVKLTTFLKKKKPANVTRLPILFANDKYQKMFQNILDRWSWEYGGEENLFRVYSLQVLLFWLRNKVSGGEVWHTVTFSDREIEKDVYAYVPDIACHYHSKMSSSLYCSQSNVLRMAYVVCDNCCEDLDIELLPGQHVPVRSSVPIGTSSVKSFSTRTSRSTEQRGNKSHWEQESDFDATSMTDWENRSLISETSATTTVNTDRNFPPLGPRMDNKRQFPNLPQSSSTVGASYSDAFKSLPAAFENMVIRSAKGRGIPRKDDDTTSVTSSVVSKGRGYSVSSGDDSAPKGRGFRRGAPKRPGPAN